MKIHLPISQRYATRKGHIKVLYSLNNYIIPLGTNSTVNTFYLRKAKEDMVSATKLAIKDIQPLDITYPINIVVTIYRGSNHGVDMGNFCMIEKFATDTIVKAGIIPDDSYKYIASVLIQDGGLDQDNPRAEYELVEHVT